MYSKDFVKTLWDKVRCGYIRVYGEDNKEFVDIHMSLLDFYQKRDLVPMRIVCYDVSMSFLEGMSKNKDITDEELEEIFYNKQLDNLTPEEFAVVKDIQSNIADTYSEYFVGEPTLYIENERVCVEFA